MERSQLTSGGHEGLEISRGLEFSMWSELGHWVGTRLRWKEKVWGGEGMLVRRPECKLLMTKFELLWGRGINLGL